MGTNTDDDVRAIESALSFGVDVINMSYGLYDGTGCLASDNSSNIGEALQNALNAGTVIVKSAGNGSHAAGCTLSWPAMRRELLTVNGVGTNNELLPYNAFPILGNASRGSAAITVYGSGVTTPISAVDLTAPGCSTEWGIKVFSLFSYKPSGNNGGGCGSSDATAITSSVIGGMRNTWAALGFGYADARLTMANALVMGDGWDGDDGTIHTTGMSSLSGAGRVRTHWPGSNDLTGPWGWGWRAVTIHQNETVTFPVGGVGVESSAVTDWKWAALWTPLDLQSVPDVDFYVDNTCPFGGGTATLWSDTGYDVRARFRLNQSQISGRCLQMRLYGYSVPPEGVTVYMADYFHSGSTANH